MNKSLFKLIIALGLISTIYYSCENSKKIENSSLVIDLPQYSIPNDVIDSCSLDSIALAGWFADGNITENGFVNPANSVTFNPENNCSFYTWSEQMFLWLTSSGSKYKGGATVFESPVFYTVSPESSDTTRTLVPYKQGENLDATADIVKVNTEEGQATNNVLLDRHGNLVYYITFVNDVYAALLHMAAQNGSSVTKFPTTQDELNTILAYAAKNNISILEPNVLAIELKSSWVKLEGDMKAEDFVTISADIPVYDKTSDTLWILNGKTTATLALVGLHIVGSAANHPEMIWSTFEHKYNSPNAAYQYVSKDSKVISVGPDNEGYWLFNNAPMDTAINSANQSYADFNSNNIVATEGHTIAPSNTIRVLPWGNAYNLKPNQQNGNSAYANSELISINNSIINQLVGNDVRKNYILIGSTWTFGGAAPNGKSFTADSNLSDGVAIGNSNLANSTMETDFQEKSIMVSNSKNHVCFTCHNGKNNDGSHSLDPKINDGLSHVFYPLMNGLKLKPRLLKSIK